MNKKFHTFAQECVSKIVGEQITLPELETQGSEIKLGKFNALFIQEIGERQNIFIAITLPKSKPYLKNGVHYKEKPVLYIHMTNGFWKPSRRNSCSVKAWIPIETRKYRAKNWWETELPVIPYTYCYDDKYQDILDQLEDRFSVGQIKIG